MTITCNGQAVEFEGESLVTVQSFLDARGFKADRIAVEQNGEILSRKQWEATALKDGDRLEVVHFVGGG